MCPGHFVRWQEAPEWTEYDEDDEQGQHVQAQQDQRRARSRSQTVYGSDREGGLATARQAAVQQTADGQGSEELASFGEHGGSASFSSSEEGVPLGAAPEQQTAPSKSSGDSEQEAQASHSLQAGCALAGEATGARGQRGKGGQRHLLDGSQRFVHGGTLACAMNSSTSRPRRSVAGTAGEDGCSPRLSFSPSSYPIASTCASSRPHALVCD